MLRPFRYRQAGGGDPLNTLCFEFPEGARVIFENGESFIEFTTARAYFNDDVENAFETEGGATRRLPLGEIPQTTFAWIFSLDAAKGVRFDLWGLVPIVWYGGSMSESGLTAARLRLPSSILPLPPNNVAEATRYEDSDSGVSLTLVYHGMFQIADGPTVLVSKKNPLTLKIEPDGTFSLSAPVEVSFESGAKFKGWLGFADPFYQFTFRATGITIPLLASLAGSLPEDPRACIAQESPTNAQLSQAALCLDAYKKSYRAFGATASAEIPEEEGDNAALFATATGATVTNLINAWGFRMAAGGHAIIDGEETGILKKLVGQTGDSAIASGDLPLISEHLAALIQAQVGLESALLQGAAADDVNALSDEISEALAKANGAAIAAAESPEALKTLGSLDVLLTNFSKMHLLLLEAQEKGLEINLQPAFVAAMKRAIERAVADRIFALGVLPGVYQAPPDSPIQSMNRFLLQKHVSEFVTIYSRIAVIELFDVVIAQFPFFEAANQLMLRQQECCKRARTSK